MSAAVRETILDDNFWDNTERTVDLLKPIGVGTDRMQSGSEPVSVVFYTFSEWERLYAVSDEGKDKKKKKKTKEEVDQEALKTFVLASVAKRWNLISDCVHAAAFSIDPRFRNEELEIVHLDDAESYLKG